MRYKNKMRYQILILAYWLWIATTSKADECEIKFQCGHGPHASVAEYNFMCDRKGYIDINCSDAGKGNRISECNASIRADMSYISYLCQNEQFILVDSNNANNKSIACTAPAECDTSTICTPEECRCTPIVENTTLKPTSDIINDTSNSSNSTIAAVLGALVGLLLLLLVAVTAALIWTCWQLKKWKGMKCNADYQLRSGTDHGQLVNPTYEGDDLLHLQQRQPAPAYETIPPHPRDGARLEFIEQGDNGYHVLSREQRVNPKTNTTSRCMETIPEDSREESYSKLELREECGSTKKANEEEYSKLETMNIGSNLSKDTCLDNDATVVSNDDSSEQTEGKRSVTDKKTFNDDGDVLQLESGDVKKNGKEEETKGEQPLIAITPDAQNNRKDSTNPETSTIDNA